MKKKRKKKPKSLIELILEVILASAAIISSIAQLIQALK